MAKAGARLLLLDERKRKGKKKLGEVRGSSKQALTGRDRDTRRRLLEYSTAQHSTDLGWTWRKAG